MLMATNSCPIGLNVHSTKENHARSWKNSHFPGLVRSRTLEKNLLPPTMLDQYTSYALNVILKPTDKCGYHSHQASLSLQQMENITENHNCTQCRMQQMWRAQPQGIHLHYSSHIYGSGTTT